MKTKYWILLLGLLLAVSLVAAAWIGNHREARAVQVYSQGQLLYTLPLSVDTAVTVETDRGTNTITVRGGKVAVTAASCPDGYCMKRGFCSGGAQIVCLPNRLVLKFTTEAPVDAVAG